MAGLQNKVAAQKALLVEEKKWREQALRQWQSIFSASENARSAHLKQHWQHVKEQEIPLSSHEDWKYTSLNDFLQQSFLSAQSVKVEPSQLTGLRLPVDAWCVVFVNGVYEPELSDSDLGPYIFTVLETAEQKSIPDAINPEIFLHLTESLAQTRSLITLPAKQQTEKPLYLLHLSSCSEHGLNTVHTRHHIHIGMSAQAQVLEHYVSLSDGAHFSGARLTFTVEDNAQLDHLKLAFESSYSYHFAHNDLHLGRDVQVQSQSFLLGAGLCRHNSSARLNGEGANLNMNSLMLPTQRQICDTRSYLEHNVGYCESRQLHKSIVYDGARAVFNGLIKVAINALKTDGQMTNNNLLLGQQAEVDTKPQLEIYADDVKCGHGATIGRIDKEQMFYLRSRGIREEDALRMIIHAFAAELTEAIGDDLLRKAVLKRIEESLAGKAFLPSLTSKYEFK